MTSSYYSLVETNIKNVQSYVCQVLIKLFKICGDFVEVRDDNDNDPEMANAEHKGRSTRCDNQNQSQSLGEDGLRGQTLGHHMIKCLCSLIFN